MVRRNIVEGEPGIFPDPIARLLAAIARLLRRRRGRDEPAGDEPSDGERRDGTGRATDDGPGLQS